MSKKTTGYIDSSEEETNKYTELLQKSELIEYTDVSGCYIFRPRAYKIWENIQKYFNDLITADGVKNAYFPLFIPEKLLKKESEHIKGFNPEVAWVTHAGDTKLQEKLAIRPTSETIMYPAYAKWIRSYKDLPLRLNQWCNIVRWEFKHPVPFIRSREFLWQEGHTAFATKQEADKEAEKILSFYKKTAEELLAIPVIAGKKSDKEKFAGADYTLSIETFLPNGKAIQCATSHHLGQNFSKPFNIKFLDKDEKTQYAWQNSWGLSTRMIGTLVMIHSDSKGLILPPKIAPTQVIIIPILFKDTKKKVLIQAEKIRQQLKDFTVEIDSREEYTPGWKFSEYELKGIPLRIEIGPKDIEKKQVIAVRRDNFKKEIIKISGITKKVREILKDIQDSIFKKAKKHVDSSVIEPKDMNELIKAIKNKKLALVQWCKSKDCEENMKYKTQGAKTLVIPFKQKIKGNCIYCNKKSQAQIYIAKSY